MYLSIMAGCQQMLRGCCQSRRHSRMLHQLLSLCTFAQACSSSRHPAVMFTSFWQHVRQTDHDYTAESPLLAPQHGLTHDLLTKEMDV